MCHSYLIQISDKQICYENYQSHSFIHSSIHSLYDDDASLILFSQINSILFICIIIALFVNFVLGFGFLWNLPGLQVFIRKRETFQNANLIFNIKRIIFNKEEYKSCSCTIITFLGGDHYPFKSILSNIIATVGVWGVVSCTIISRIEVLRIRLSFGQW